MTINSTSEKIHQGRNIRRFREMLGLKQDVLANELGEDWNQQKISLLEQKESIDEDLLAQVSKVLKVPVEAIKNFDEQSAINIIANTFHDTSFSHNVISPNNCSFNPIDKIVELYQEKIALYERMLKDRDNMIEELKKR